MPIEPQIQEVPMRPEAPSLRRLDTLHPATRAYVTHLKDQFSHLLDKHALSPSDLRDPDKLKGIPSETLSEVSQHVEMVRRFMEPCQDVEDRRLDDYPIGPLKEINALFLNKNISKKLTRPFEEKMDEQFRNLATVDPDLWIGFLKNMLENPDFGDHVFDRVVKLYEQHLSMDNVIHRSNMYGLFLSITLNSIMKSIPDAIRPLVSQKFDLAVSHLVNYFGYHHVGGNFQVENAGKFFGCGMKEGELFAESVNDDAGYEMDGGKMTLVNARDRVGILMMGGLINVENAHDNLGVLMSGGRIAANVVNDWAGSELSGGLIIINRAGICCGNRMQDGQIQVNYAGSELGVRMNGGKIYVKKADTDVGKSMTRGKIFISDEFTSLGEGRRPAAEIYFKGTRIG